jgi:hypothetical protein
VGSGRKSEVYFAVIVKPRTAAMTSEPELLAKKFDRGLRLVQSKSLLVYALREMDGQLVETHKSS